MSKIEQWRYRLKLDQIQLTYSSLIRMSLGIIGVFVLASIIYTQLKPVSSIAKFQRLAFDDYRSAEKELSEYLETHPDSEEHWRFFVDLRSMFKQGPIIAEDEVVDFQNLQRKMNHQTYFSAADFLLFLDRAKKPSPQALKLRFLYNTSKGKNPELLFSGVLRPDEKLELAKVFLASGKFAKSLALADELIAAGVDNDETRKLSMKALTYTKDYSALEKRLSLPEWSKYASNNVLYKYHFEKGNYGQIFYYVNLSQFDHYTWKSIVICLVAGFGWALFLIHLGGGWSWPKLSYLKVLGAIFLGVVSTWLCLFVVVLQDHWIGYDGQEKTLIYNLAYCIFGIGLREEVCKMLLFCPLLLFLRKEQSHCKILIYSSLVGLGFAMEENFSYISQAAGDPSALMGRFMTANFLHMLLTGYICYYLTIAVQKKGRHWDDFTNAFIRMVLYHGIYDFLLIDKNMVAEGMSFFAIMLYIWIAMQYLRLIIQVSPPSHRYVSLSRVFTIVITISFGLSLFFISMDIGLVEALKASFAAIIGNIIFAYMFYYEFNEVVH
jgi:protease PrsW